MTKKDWTAEPDLNRRRPKPCPCWACLSNRSGEYLVGVSVDGMSLPKSTPDQVGLVTRVSRGKRRARISGTPPGLLTRPGVSPRGSEKLARRARIEDAFLSRCVSPSRWQR
jgi:hypothetical protein